MKLENALGRDDHFAASCRFSRSPRARSGSRSFGSALPLVEHPSDSSAHCSRSANHRGTGFLAKRAFTEEDVATHKTKLSTHRHSDEAQLELGAALEVSRRYCVHHFQLSIRATRDNYGAS